MSQIIRCTDCGMELGLLRKDKTELRNGTLHEYPGQGVEITCLCGKVNKVY